MKKYLLRKLSGKISFPLMKEAFFCMIFSFIILGLVLIIGLNLNFFSPFKNAFKDFSYLDLYYSEKLNEGNFDLNKDIILVNIDRLNRKEIAEVLDELQKYEPKVIGLDVIFKEKKDPVWDSYLAEKLKEDSFVLAYAIIDEKEISTDNSINNSSQNRGYTNFNFDNESVVIRNFQGIKKIENETLVSFPLKVAKKFLNNDWFKNKNAFFEIERPINYSGQKDEFLVLESRDIIGENQIPFIKDKIVLVGYLGNENTHMYDIEDKHYTPMNSKFVGKSPPDMFGVVVHANIVQMIISNNYIKIVPIGILTLLTIVFTFIVLAYFIYISKKQLASYILRLNIVQLLFIVCFTWISLLFFRKGILFKITTITAVVVFTMGLIGYYKKLAHYLYKRFKWEGYFYHD